MRAALAALLVTAPAFATMPDATSPPNGQRLVFLGDSLTAGYMLNRQSAYPALIEQRIRAAGLPWTVLNAGVSGDTSAGALRRADAILRDPVGLLVLWIGGNDGLRGQDTGALKRNVTQILASAKAKQVPVMLVEMHMPPNLGRDYTRAFSAVFTDVARELSVPLIPFALDGTAGEEDMNLADGIHPNARGHQKIAEHLWRYLEPRLRELTPRETRNVR